MKHDIPKWVNQRYYQRQDETRAPIRDDEAVLRDSAEEDAGMFWFVLVIVWLFFMIAVTVYDNIQLTNLLTR